LSKYFFPFFDIFFPCPLYFAYSLCSTNEASQFYVSEKTGILLFSINRVDSSSVLMDLQRQSRFYLISCCAVDSRALKNNLECMKASGWKMD